VLEEIFTRIESFVVRVRSSRATIIGINGVDNSGKTTFAIELERCLKNKGYKIALIHLDDFHNPRNTRTRNTRNTPRTRNTRNTPRTRNTRALRNAFNSLNICNQGDDPVQSYFDNAFNLELLEKEILAPARGGELVDKELFLLDLESDTYVNRKRYRIDKDTIVILEGVLLYREPLDRYFDLRIFLDIPFSEVLRRAGKRDVSRFGPGFLSRYKTRYIPVQKRYLEDYSPRERSDMVIDNTDFTNPRIVSTR
jgi:phosphoglycolate phosphatase